MFALSYLIARVGAVDIVQKAVARHDYVSAATIWVVDKINLVKLMH